MESTPAYNSEANALLNNWVFDNELLKDLVDQNNRDFDEYYKIEKASVDDGIEKMKQTLVI